LGKYHPGSAHPQPDAKSCGLSECNTVSVVNCIGDIIGIAIADVCVSGSQSGRHCARWFDTCADGFTSREGKLSQESEAVNAGAGYAVSAAVRRSCDAKSIGKQGQRVNHSLLGLS
jgi:hypothetical protein